MLLCPTVLDKQPLLAGSNIYSRSDVERLALLEHTNPCTGGVLTPLLLPPHISLIMP